MQIMPLNIRKVLLIPLIFCSEYIILGDSNQNNPNQVHIRF